MFIPTTRNVYALVVIPLLLLGFLAALTAPASDWQCTSEPPITVPGGRCQTSTWTMTAAGGGAHEFSSTSLVLAPGARLKLVEQPEGDPTKRQSVAALMTASGGVAAMNGGYFTARFMPAGLLTIDGRAVTPISDEIALSGYLIVDAAGAISLRTRKDGAAGAASARQAGPFVIDPGGGVGIRQSGQPTIAKRSIIVVSTTGDITLVATSAVSLYDLAICLHDKPTGFGVPTVERALSLDGGPSTALSIAGLPEPVVFTETAPVRDVVVVMAPGK